MADLPGTRYSEEWEDSQKERFDKLLKRDIDKLVRAASTEFNFNEIRPRLNDVIEWTQTLAENFDIWSHISDSARNSINSALDDMVVQFNEMENFDPKQNDAWNLRNALISNFNSRFNGFYEQVIKPIGSYLGKKAYSEEISSEYGKKAAEGLKEIQKTEREINKIHQKVQDASEVAGGVASTAHSRSFAGEASDHSKKAQHWFWGVIISLVIAFAVSVPVLYDIYKELTNDSYKASTESYIIKVAILAFVFIWVRFAVKNYSAHQHLCVVNKHRANVLSSMEAFRTSAIDDKTKDSILLAGVGAAYSQQETGFITTKEGAGSDDGDILDIVKSVTNKI